MKHILIVAAALSASAAFGQANNQSLSAGAAQQMIAGCEAFSRAKGQGQAIAVTDAGGNLVAALRMDGNPQGVMDFALAKARAAANWGFGTAEMAEAVKSTPGFAAAPGVVTVAGGVPVFSADGKQRLGAIGVSGEAPEDDLACAKAGIEAASLRWSRTPR
jgi:uncharacterized protein GlcG (DUF336 family)